MREALGTDYFANSICMIRGTVKGAICLTSSKSEGTFAELILDHTVTMFHVDGNIHEVINELECRQADGIVAIARSNGNAGNDSIFCPETDVENLVLDNPATVISLEQATGRGWFRSFFEGYASPVEWSKRIASSLLPAWDVDGAQQGEHKFVSGHVDWHAFEPDVAAIADGYGKEVAELVKNYRYGEGRLAHGRLSLAVLSVATEKVCPRGLSCRQAFLPQSLFAIICAGFDLDHFEKDQMFWRIKFWELKAQKWVLLRPWRIKDPLGVLLDQRYWLRDLTSIVNLGFERIVVFKIDLDNFKGVNDVGGHSYGDDAIILASVAVMDCLGSRALIYRRGGDEIVAIAYGMDADDGHEVAERLRSEIESRFLVWVRETSLSCVAPTASIGVVEVLGAKTVEQIVSAMDRTQARAKAEGKNRVVFESI